MNILVVRIGRMGDIVMMLPALLEIHRRYPDANIDMITSKEGKRVVSQAPLTIRHVVIYDARLLHRFSSQLKVTKLLKKIDYDKVYLFENKKRYNNWFLNASADVSTIANVKQEHFSDACLEVSGCAKEDWLKWRARKLLEAQSDAELSLTNVLKQYLINDQTLLVALHPSYSGIHKNEKDKPHKVWPMSYWAQLSEMLVTFAREAERDIKVIADFLPNEHAIAAELKHACGDNVIVLQEPVNFKRYIAYMSRVNILVAPNTGAMHLAAALNTPVVALFSGHPDKSCIPFSSQDQYRVINADELAGDGGLSRIKSIDVMEAIKQLCGI